VLAGIILVSDSALATATVLVNDFSSFSLGSVNGQGASFAWQSGYSGEGVNSAWRSNDPNAPSNGAGGSPFDQSVVDVGGSRYWRMSNAVTSSGFSNQPFVAASAIAGEAGSLTYAQPSINGGNLASTTNQFNSTVYFQSATGAAQAGLSLTLSASALQSTVRMTFLAIVDTGTGFDLRFYESGLNGSFAPSATTIATGLSYTANYKLEKNITFVDGVNGGPGNITGNDIVEIKLNDVLIHTGTTWESYYYLNELAPSGGNPRLQAVNSLLFRAAGTAASGTNGQGFLFGQPTVIPGSGLAAIGTLGLAGMARRRRR
jgi:hypothetical protein